jgi:hypothetical protein
MDDDLERMSREQLIEEVKKLCDGIREHRDSSLHELCWHHPALWGSALGENRSGTRCAELAGVHQGLRPIPAIA